MIASASLSQLLAPQSAQIAIGIFGVSLTSHLSERQFLHCFHDHSAPAKITNPSFAPASHGPKPTVMDLYSRRIVGWAMEDHLRANRPRLIGPRLLLE
jgi:hypothetical protein